MYDGFDGDYVLSQVAQNGEADFYDSERPYYSFGPFPNYNRANQFFRDNADLFEISDADTIAESFGVDYRVKETITAGYLMGQLQVGNATFIAGARVEQTDTDFDAFDIVFVDGDSPNPPPAVHGTKKYTNVLPDLLMTWAIRDDLLLRAAWTNTIGRPSYEQNVPFRIFEIEEDDPDVFEGEIEAGNSDLDPLEAMNYDLALEWYLEPAGLLSAGLFYKDIDNPIFNRVQVLEDEEFEGRFYSELAIQQFQNASSGNIIGVELGFQQQFTGLPGLLRGLGVSLSYTWTDSEAEVDVLGATRKVPFFLQSEHIGNIALFYELSGLELRVAYAYRSEYLDTIGDTEASGPVRRHARAARLQGELPVHEAGLGVHPVAEHQRRAAALLQRRPLADGRERDLLLEHARRHELQVLKLRSAELLREDLAAAAVDEQLDLAALRVASFDLGDAVAQLDLANRDALRGHAALEVAEAQQRGRLGAGR